MRIPRVGRASVFGDISRFSLDHPDEPGGVACCVPGCCVRVGMAAGRADRVGPRSEKLLELLVEGSSGDGARR